MRLVEIRIENFRGLKQVSVPLGKFGCLIGENNSGKSSVLQAVLVLLQSASAKRPVTADDFYDSTSPIRIELQIDKIDDSDLERITEVTQRDGLRGHIVDGALTLVRTVPTSLAKSQLRVLQKAPKDQRLSDDYLSPLMKGNTGAKLREVVVAELPQLDPYLDSKITQASVKAARDQFVLTLPAEDFELAERPLATGLDAGIKPFLPEPIYIEAVKDVTDEVKTTDSATFGKLLGLLLEEVQDQFSDIDTKFREIQKKLSRVIGADGKVVDERLDQVKHIEEIIARFVGESFPGVGFQIDVPVPKMKTILSSAEIHADDGHSGPLATKGDGLKRAVAFAILRAYMQIKADGEIKATGDSSRGHYWLLFEEPELYLYPWAQQQLFNALEVFSSAHPVMVTTHSPAFFDAASTVSFTKLRKVEASSGSPYTEALPIAIDDIAKKTAFQIICHENNNIAFFARKVVLVEGDSDAAILRHVAKLLNPAWDAGDRNISFARIGGKTNITAYRDFFRRFDIPVYVICDLDTLVRGFEQINSDAAVKELRDQLLVLADGKIAKEEETEITKKQAQSLATSGDAKGLWSAVLAARASLDGSASQLDSFEAAVENFFAFTRKGARVSVLSADDHLDVRAAKMRVIRSLRAASVHVLAAGTIEDYYNASSKHNDKVRQAVEFCAACTDVDSYTAALGLKANEITAELREIFAQIFDESGPAPSDQEAVDVALDTIVEMASEEQAAA